MEGSVLSWVIPAPGRELVHQQPNGFTTGDMLSPIRDFNQSYPASTLALPLEKVIEELQTELPLTATSGYSLLTLADEFYDTVYYITGIPSGGPERITYKLKQDLTGRPVVQLDAVLEITLTPDERRRATWNGSSVYVAELVQGGKQKLTEAAKQRGFIVTEIQHGNVAESHLQFAFTLPEFGDVLQTKNLNHVAVFLHQITQICRRF